MKIGLFCLVENYTDNVHEAIMDQLGLVELADELGFDEVWFGEHHFNGFSVIPDPCSMIGYAAGRTGCIRLGTAGFLAPFYHPVRLAESIATLDHLSNGRINAGFAKGGFAPDTRHFVRSKEDLRSIMFETVESVDLLLHGQPTTYEGKFIQLNNATLTPPPFQKEVPFYIATFSSEETIAFAAQNGYGLMMSQGATLHECIEAQNFYRSIAGHDPQIIIMRMFYLDESFESAARNILPAIDHFVRCMRAAQEEQTQPTFDIEHYEELLKERKAFFNGQKFFDNAIMGTPTQCLETIQTIQKEIPRLEACFIRYGSKSDHVSGIQCQYSTQNKHLRKKMKKSLLLLSLVAASALYSADGVFELGRVNVADTADSISSTTTVIDAQQIQDHNAKTIVEAINLLPGATIQSFGARNEQMIMIRGFDVKHAPLFIDGIPIAVPYDGYVDFSRFTTFDLSEIEVTKGLASPLLGANTFAGAINLVTKKPTKAFEGDMGLGAFSGNGRTGYINLGTNQGSYYVQASASKTQLDTYPLSDDFTPIRTINEDGGDRNNAYASDRKINIKAGYTPNTTDEYALNYIDQHSDKGVPPDVATNLSGRGFWQWRYWDKQSLYFLSKTDFGNWYLKSRVFYDQFQNSLAIYTNNGLYDTYAYGGVGNPSWYDEYTKGASIESGVKLSPENTLKMALNYKIDDHQEGGANQAAVYEMKDTISSLGIEDTHIFSEALKLTIGASYDKEEIDTAQNTQYGKSNTSYYNDNTGTNQNTTTGYTTDQEFAHGDTSSFNPMIKLEGQIDQSLSWYGGVSGKSRIPSIKDRYSFKFNTFVPNPDLDVEKTINYEVGGTKSFGNASFNGAIFYADVSDYIQSAYIPLWYKNGTNYTQQQQLQNVGKVTQKGFELSAVYAPFESLTVEGSYTYLKMTNEIDESQKITDVPKEKFIATVAYSPIENLTWFNTYEYDSERYASVGTTGTAPNTKNTYDTTGCVSVWNTKVTYNATKAFSFDLGINNVLDRNYYYSYSYPEAGRSVFGNIRYKF